MAIYRSEAELKLPVYDVQLAYQTFLFNFIIELCAYALHRTPEAELKLPVGPASTGEVSPDFIKLFGTFLQRLQCVPHNRRTESSKKHQSSNKPAHQTKKSNKDTLVRQTPSKQHVPANGSQ